MSEFAFQCRACGDRRTRLLLDLGVQPLANNLLRREDLSKEEPRFPLRLAVCSGCWLMQIVDDVPPVTLFSQYLYFSSFSDAMLRHAANAAGEHIKRFGLGKDSLVVEIASNDGYLLRNFVKAEIPCLGIEPAENIAKVAREKGVETVSEFFSRDLAARFVAEGKQADLILGNNVFAHVPDTNGFAAAVKMALKPGGSAVLEFPYGVDFIENNEFDTIYHEHVFYFTITPLLPLFARHGLQVWRVERIPIHGGSLRIFVGHEDAVPVEPSVRTLLDEEKSKGVASAAYYDDFAKNVLNLKNDLCSLIRQLKQAGKTVAAYGASAKGSTLLNFYGLGAESLDFVADRSTYKQGRFTPGTHLAILPPEALLERMPDYAVLLTWNFAEEILRQQSAYRAAGGKFIIPLPRVEVL
jgi:SAM-dependent methyltransferase